jgi:N-dimethylarginine dimethylaminohydrolase
VPNPEPWGANTLALNGTVLVTGSSPQTADLLESKGLRVRRLDISELQKAEAALTCLSGLLHKYAHVRCVAFGLGLVLLC